VLRSSRPWVNGERAEPTGIDEPELAASLLEGTNMMRTVLVALMTIAFLGACGAPQKTQYSVTPKVKVVVKGAKKKGAQANYRSTPEESKLTGSGGSAK
jgi:hypothetical protein